MEKIISLIFVVLIGIFFPICTIADDGQTVEIPTVINPDPQIEPKDPKNDPEPNEPPKGLIPNRKPSRPVIITITDGQGVMIPGVDKDDILSYSIYNEDGMLVAMYADDIAFAQAVFAMAGVFEIRIALDGYALCGWMEN